jgi:hypothetical protein
MRRYDLLATLLVEKANDDLSAVRPGPDLRCGRGRAGETVAYTTLSYYVARILGTALSLLQPLPVALQIIMSIWLQ